MPVREHQRRGPCEHAGRGGGDRWSGSGDDLGSDRGRDVTAHAGQIIELVPQMQKKLFHSGVTLRDRHTCWRARAHNRSACAAGIACDALCIRACSSCEACVGLAAPDVIIWM